MLPPAAYSNKGSCISSYKHSFTAHWAGLEILAYDERNIIAKDISIAAFANATKELIHSHHIAAALRSVIYVSQPLPHSLIYGYMYLSLVQRCFEQFEAADTTTIIERHR